MAQPGAEIAEREPQHPTSGGFLRDIVFGANDGVVTAIGFLVGISGSVAEQSIVVIAGALTIIAGAASMALGNYLAVKSQREFYDQMEKIERWEMEHKPDVETDEIREIYTNYGFDKQTVEILTKKVTSDKELWLKVMMRDELGLAKEDSPTLAGVIIGLFYLLAGIPPLLPFIFFRPLTRALIMSVIVAIFVMALIGFIRWWLNKGSLGSKVTETIVIGLVAAGIGFAAGEALKLFGISGVSI
ncbi:MAG: VIT1/CCC1 transporter family protein [Candidatus Curtissbacteria bacterium]|nr:VIT1/CCC1 transporter family protein [Candidatus Curtissbacteria bacterium]MDZ4209899.1 VIT1/CCC1 transporter family protein [Candidatus Curtissbacteria bacterium]